MRRAAQQEEEDFNTRRGRTSVYEKHTGGLGGRVAHTPDSLAHSRDDEVHRSPRRTSIRESRGSRSEGVNSSTMPPPPHLSRSSTDAYRRPINTLATDGRYEAASPAVRRIITREISPGYNRRRPVGEYSGRSSASGLAYGEDDEDHIEVVEEVEDEPTPRRERRQPSRDDYMDSSSDRRYHGRRRRAHPSDEEVGVRRRFATSDGGSAEHESSRTPDRSLSSLQGRRHHHVPDVIEDSRPPVSSKRPTVHRRHRSAEVIGTEPSRLRRSSTGRSSRSRAGSVSGAPSSIFGSIFRSPSGRQVSPEKQPKDARSPKKRVECVICMGDMSHSKASRLKCGHSMCRSCLERIFKLSMTDPQHMPPRCCTQDHIPLRHVDRLFDNAFKKNWNRKFAEYSTKNRIYCPSRRCGEWIKPANIRREDGRKVARCSRCKTKVCCACNGRWHGHSPCPNDPETARLLAQAKEEGWKRCYRCKALVELKEGCNHMTCRCGAEFCMICGVKWKGCDCPWFNDDDRRGDFLDDMNVPVPHIRGNARDIFRAEGHPEPGELRGQPGPTYIPIRRRPRTYQEEMHMRRVQEHRDADMARHMQYNDDFYDNHNMMGGVGDINGIGNAAGHHMNENYRRDGRYRPAGPDRAAEYGTPDPWRSRSNREEASQERRMGHGRAGGSPPRLASMVPPAMATKGSPVKTPGLGALRQHSPEEEAYNQSPHTPRSERVVGGRLSRNYEDEAGIHSPRRMGSRRSREERTKSSDMAGLNGPGRGMNRVTQWRAFVEPGVPDGESVVGHA